MRTTVEDPVKKFRFRVEVDGFVRMGFAEVGGLSRETAVTAYREGGVNETEQKSPGLTSFGDITLKRGVVFGSGDDDFNSWFEQVFKLGVAGNPGNFRRTITIIQVGNDGNDLWAWDVVQAWPKSDVPVEGWSGSASENQMESLTIVHEGWERRRLA
jgi:phage tail-like protein